MRGAPAEESGNLRDVVAGIGPVGQVGGVDMRIASFHLGDLFKLK
jgi:hypothetical protein